MAYGYDINVKIRFNEHDNEEGFIDFLKEKLREIEEYGKNFRNMEWHQDVFTEIDWGELKEYLGE